MQRTVRDSYNLSLTQISVDNHLILSWSKPYTKFF